MSRFKRMLSLQKFASTHSSVHNHFDHQRNIERRAGFELLRDAAFANSTICSLSSAC